MPFYKWSDLEEDDITPSYSSARGPNIEGETIMLGIFSYPAGTRGKPHAHPNEQIQSVIKGKARVRIGDEERIIGPGDAVLIPANTEHSAEILEDLQVFNCKNVVSGWSVKNAKWDK